jgi:hypothetical protein
MPRNDRDPLNDLIDQIRITETMDGPEDAHDATVHAVARILSGARDPHRVLRDARDKADMSDVDMTATATDLTRQIRADVRSLNHLTMDGGFAFPSDVYDTVGNLAAVAAMLPQALQQTTGWLRREWRGGRIASVEPGRPAADQVTQFTAWMRSAGGETDPRRPFDENNGTAGQLAKELDKAWQTLGCLATNNPALNPVDTTEGAPDAPVFRDIVMSVNRQYDGAYAALYRTRRPEFEIPAEGADRPAVTDWAQAVIAACVAEQNAPALEPGGYTVTIQIETGPGHRWTSTTITFCINCNGTVRFAPALDVDACTSCGAEQPDFRPEGDRW